MTRYVCGFLFWRNWVLLVRKERPAWQRGHLNGIGGKVSPDDATVLDAMTREWREELGGRIPIAPWDLFASMRGRDFELFFYKHDCSQLSVRPVPPGGNDAGEMLGWVPVEMVLDPYKRQFPIVADLAWALPLAMDQRRIMARMEVDL